MTSRDRPDELNLLLWEALRQSGVGRAFMILSPDPDGTAFIEGEVSLGLAVDAFLESARAKGLL